ncbi:THAP domain-containing protein 7-like [Gigantopelta aegis]|uniref:THAP domain-containing protein 7-like n=1 Tax=Gigantopelta aegis TaxID=1735272 RepID=UPI001B88769F|nr:THAP domain-containing protein 7-like [Gigantopelta aegis]
MVKHCCVFNCSNNKARQDKLSFYMIPNEVTEPERRKRWIQAIGRAHINDDGTISNKMWEPRSDYTYVCSAHFISGSKVNNQSHPDFVPSLFPSKKESKTSASNKVDRFHRCASRQVKRTESQETGSKTPARKRLKLTSSRENDSAVESIPDSPLSTTSCVLQGKKLFNIHAVFLFVHYCIFIFFMKHGKLLILALPFDRSITIIFRK